MKPPDFWYGEAHGLLPQVLRPVGALYALSGQGRRALQRPWYPTVPVICVGNLTAGGTGKTPTAIAIARFLRSRGLEAHFLSRGYGGTNTSPLQVDPSTHDAVLVGDEPLLLASVAPTWVSPDRKASAELAIEAGAKVLVMDDGFQNPSLHKDVSIVVVDGEVGFGNGRVMPAGPLREPMLDGLSRADVVLIVGEDKLGLAATLTCPREKPLTILRAKLMPDPGQAIAGKTVVAFAGIGRPEKFFTTLREMGCEIADTTSFDDHHPYSVDEIDTLVQKAASMNTELITTTKDHARLAPDQASNVRALAVHLAWDDAAALELLLQPVLPDAE